MNMRILRTLATALFALWGFAFPARAEKPSLKIAIEEVLSIGGLDDEALFQWTGVASESDGSIFVLDAMDYSLKKFDASGQLLKKTGRKGQGPGEFLAPRLLDCSGRFVFATDQYILGISVFDQELNYIKKILFPAPITSLKALPDGRLAVVALSPQGAGKIVVVDGEGKVQSEFRYLEHESGLLMDSVSLAPAADGSFYIAFLFQDKVEKWDPSGKRLWSRNLLGGKKSETKKIDKYVMPTETLFKDIALDHRGHIFVLGGRHSKNPSRDIYVLSPDGENLAIFTLPDTSHCLYIDSRNFLYARANDGVTLKKYKLIYN